MKPFKDIYKHKNSDIAIFLGCGPSINNITKEQWSVISKFDTWVNNNFIYHDFIPKFYHVEIKKNNNFETWKYWRYKVKSEKYNDVVFIIKNHPKRKFLLEAVDPINSKYIYGYHVKKINIKSKEIIPNYKISSKYITCNCNASFTMILEMFYKFKYNKIILFGVDLNNSKYFWSNDNIDYGGKKSKINMTYNGHKVHCNSNKNQDPTKQHTTSHLVKYISYFNKLYMKKIKSEIYVGHKKTLLYPELSYINIMNL